MNKEKIRAVYEIIPNSHYREDYWESVILYLPYKTKLFKINRTMKIEIFPNPSWGIYNRSVNIETIKAKIEEVDNDMGKYIQNIIQKNIEHYNKKQGNGNYASEISGAEISFEVDDKTLNKLYNIGRRL